jgi:acyl-CoA hydrolase
MSTDTEPPADRGSSDDDLHRLSMTILMTPDMSNFAGNVHGGLLLKYLDQVAYTCATRWSRTYAVTLSVDQVVFREPVHVGELVTFQASVNRTGRTSMEIGVRVTTEDLVSQVVRHTNSGYFTVVAVGPVGDRLRSRRGSRPPPKNAVGTGPLVGVGSSSRKSSVPPRRSGRRRPPDHNAAGTCPPWSGGVV